MFGEFGKNRGLNPFGVDRSELPSRRLEHVRRARDPVVAHECPDEDLVGVHIEDHEPPLIEQKSGIFDFTPVEV